MNCKLVCLYLSVFTVSACIADYGQHAPAVSKNASLRAWHETAKESKTTVIDGGVSVLWEPAEEIKVFCGTLTSKYTSNNTDCSAIAEFSGSSFDSSGEIMAVYPYRSDASIYGSSITTTLPAIQIGRAGSFARNTHLVIARADSPDDGLAFYNVCGGVRFSFSKPGVKKVIFKGNNGESLAGRLTVGFTDGVPRIQKVTKTEKALILLPPSGKSFETDKWYYLEAIPGELSEGFTIQLNRAGESATIHCPSPVTIRRGIYGSMTNIDDNAPFEPAEVEPIDMGLSVMWASYNVGAASPEDYGDYFAWGETTPKNSYTIDNYKYSIGWFYTKYCQSVEHGYNGFTDEKKALERIDDAAHVQWGGNWRTPTRSEWGELFNYEKCSWSQKKYNGIEGVLVTSNTTGGSIFLPMSNTPDDGDYTGCYTGCYWSSTLNSNVDQAYAKSAGAASAGLYSIHRLQGLHVRPVRDNLATDIILDKTSVDLMAGDTITLRATVLPENASNRNVKWYSTVDTIATVNSYGKVTADRLGYGSCSIIAATEDDWLYAECLVTVTLPQMVDLGLSVKWASWDVGASRPEELGDYFAWGETSPKTVYNWDTYKWSHGELLTKYCASSGNGYDGFVDGKYTLDLTDDAAYVNWGSSWRTPTLAEWRELSENCDVTSKEYGIVLTSKINGKCILIPIGEYWTKSCGGNTMAGNVVVARNRIQTNVSQVERCRGLRIRPVCAID